jgi:(2Fe-2S) ferredoxin
MAANVLRGITGDVGDCLIINELAGGCGVGLVWYDRVAAADAADAVASLATGRRMDDESRGI